MLENVIQREIRLAANGLLMRNNVGVLKDSRGIPVRFGLANDSTKLNKEFKSSDLIGITPMVIGPQHVGETVGVFTAIETKKEDWRFSENDDRARAQLKFIRWVRGNGGIAGFANSLGVYNSLIGSQL